MLNDALYSHYSLFYNKLIYQNDKERKFVGIMSVLDISLNYYTQDREFLKVHLLHLSSCNAIVITIRSVISSLKRLYTLHKG